MAEVLVEQPTSALHPNKRHVISQIPSIDIEGVGNDENDEYSTFKKLQRHLE